MVTEAPTSSRRDARDDRKLEIVERILRGQLTLQEACAKYELSGVELKAWVRMYRREARRVLDERVRAALATQGMDLDDLEAAEFTGSVERLAVGEVIQTLALGRKDAEVLIEHDGQQSRLWCADGDVIDAECGRLIGAPAVYRLLTLERGRVHADCSPVLRQRTINVSTQALLMEGARRSDECRELRSRLGDMRAVYVPSGPAMAPGVEASTMEFAVLRLLDGVRSLEQVVLDSSMPDLETLVHIGKLRERGLMDPRVTPLPPQAAPASLLNEESELSFVPLAASLGTRFEARAPRRWVWGVVALGAGTLGAALALRFSDVRQARERAEAERLAAERSATEARLAAAARPAVPVVAPPTFACPDATALLAGAAVSPGGATAGAAAAPSTGGAFCLDRHEVTAGQYAACVAAGSCSAARPETVLPEGALTGSVRRRAQSAFASQCNRAEGNRAEGNGEGNRAGSDGAEANRAVLGRNESEHAESREQHPMNCVTYGEAEAYCAWRGGRLPSEAEWELAAVGSSRRAFPWGSAAPGPALVNACGVECKNWHTTLGLQPVFESQMYDGNDGYAGTAPVGSFPEGATPEGVLDLLGNVAEWTSGRVDVYDGDQAGQEGAVASHVVRGGAFSSGQEALTAPVLQQYLSGEARDRSVGFRCVFGATQAGGSDPKSDPKSDPASGAVVGASEAAKAALN